MKVYYTVIEHKLHRRSVLTTLQEPASVSYQASPPQMDQLPHVDMVFSKKKKGVIVLFLDGKCVYKDCRGLLSHRFHLQIFVRKPNCSGFKTSENRDLTANEYLAEPFEFLWPTFFICVQNFTSFFMVETAQSVVVTAQRGLSNCAAAQMRSLEGTLTKSLKLVSSGKCFHITGTILFRDNVLNCLAWRLDWEYMTFCDDLSGFKNHKQTLLHLRPGQSIGID